MAKNEPEAPSYEGGVTKFGDRTISSNQKVGNNVVTQYNPTESEQQAYDYLQGQLPSIYQKAFESADLQPYVDTYTQNQKDILSRDYTNSLNLLKNSLVSSGQMGSSKALDEIGQLQESYLNALANVNAQAPMQAMDLRNSEQAYYNNYLGNAINALNNYYNTGNTFNTSSSQNANLGNSFNQNNYAQQSANYNTNQQANAQMYSALANAAGQVGSAFFGGGK